MDVSDRSCRSYTRVAPQKIPETGTTIPPCSDFQVDQAPAIALVGEDNHLAIIASQDDVKGSPRRRDPWQSGYIFAATKYTTCRSG